MDSWIMLNTFHALCSIYFIKTKQNRIGKRNGDEEEKKLNKNKSFSNFKFGIKTKQNKTWVEQTWALLCYTTYSHRSHQKIWANKQMIQCLFAFDFAGACCLLVLQLNVSFFVSSSLSIPSSTTCTNIILKEFYDATYR